MTLILPRVYQEDPALYDGLSLDRRDPAYIRDLMPIQEALFRYYFRVDARGFERAPRGESFLMVGNHNGGVAAPDTGMTLHAWCLERGVDAPSYALIHPGIFKCPYLNVHAQKVGGIAATARMAVKAIETRAPLFIYPGGGDDAYKPYEDRHLISFYGQDAFIRLALRFGLAIVPVISIGAHETLIVLDNGRARARLWNLDQLGIERLPLTWSFPFGLAVGTPFTVPFPSRIGIEMGEPIRFAEKGAKAAGDAALVKRCYDTVVTTAQAIMDRLVGEREASAPAAQ
jgi:1-acyl-sn-glycerol-3-phosphate acyltransferase